MAIDPDLIKALERGTVPERTQAARSIGRLGAKGRPALSALEDCLEALPGLREAAVQGTLGCASPQAASCIEADFAAIEELKTVLEESIKLVLK